MKSIHLVPSGFNIISCLHFDAYDALRVLRAVTWLTVYRPPQLGQVLSVPNLYWRRQFWIYKFVANTVPVVRCFFSRVIFINVSVSGVSAVEQNESSTLSSIF